MKRSLIWVLSICLCTILQVQATIRFVAEDGTEMGNGLSWGTASNDLQSMIDASSEGDIILVKKGTYYTSKVTNFVSGYHETGNTYHPKYRTFLLKKGVKIYGGCTGTELDPSQRTNIAGNTTTLSGSLQGVSSSITNPNVRYAYHVVIGLGDMTGTVLDGFHIQDGSGYVASNATQKNATSTITAYDGSGAYVIQHLYGTGIYLDSKTPTTITFDNLVVQNNNATGEVSFISTTDVSYSSGGGIYSNKVNIDCGSLTVNNNSTMRNGGGIYITGGATLTGNTLICSGNFSGRGDGAGLYLDKAEEVTITNITLSNNAVYSRTESTISYGNGGGLYFEGNGTSSKLTAETITANDNIVGFSGSGLFFNNVHTINISDKLSVSNNKSKSADDKNGYGAGVYISNSNKNGTQFIIKDGEITGNSFTNIASNNNYSKNGGGLYLENIEQFKVTGLLTVSANNAKNNGGGIYANNITEINVPDLYLSTNIVSRGHGGGIYLANIEQLASFNSLELNGNQANYSNSSLGGGMYLSGTYGMTTLEVTTLKADGNISQKDGGGVFTTGIETIKITNLTLDNNTANTTTIATNNGNGGGFYASSDAGVVELFQIENLISCKGNLALRYGGAFYNVNINLFEIINPILDINVISGNRARINEGGFVYNSGSTFRAKNILATLNVAGTNGGAISLVDNSIFTADELLLTNGTAGTNGGGIYISGVNTFTVPVITLIGNTANSHGGGIYMDGGWTKNLTVTDFTVQNNTAKSNGGGIYTTQVDDIYITNLILDGNTATTNGGGIHTVGTSGRYVNSLNINKLISCSGNTATSGSGGAFYTQYVTTLFFEPTVDFEMKDNTAYLFGGAMFNEHIISLQLPLKTTFANNEVTRASSATINYAFGGAIYNNNLPGFFADNITFSGNSSAGVGGGIVNQNISGDILINTAVFNANKTTAYLTTTTVLGLGGGMYCKDIKGNITISDLTMTNNKTHRGPGAGMYFTGVTGNITVNKLFAQGNEMQNDPGYDTYPGGATFCFVGNGVANATSSITIQNGVIKDSYARSPGGGIYISTGTNMTNNLILYNMEFDNCRTINNTSGSANFREDGGAIYIYSEGTRLGKINAYFTDIHLHDCFTARDGAIYFGRSTNDIVITTDKFDYNRIENNRSRRDAPGFKVWHPQGEVLIENTVFEGNIGGRFDEIADFGYGPGISCTAGGLYTRKATGTVRNVQFINNKITDGGGGFYCAESNFTLSDLLFDGNHAYNGGGFYADAGAEATGTPSEGKAKSLIFKNNEARYWGGAMYFTIANITMADVYCSDNKAVEGGAIHTDNEKTHLYFYNAYFTGNYAERQGAVIQTTSESKGHVFVNTLFSGNRSENGEGSVAFSYMYSSNNTYVNCTFANNYANTNTETMRYGGPIANYYTEGGGDKFYNCIFYNNQNRNAVWDCLLTPSASYRVTFSNCHFTSSTSYKSNSNTIFTTIPTTGNPEFVNSVNAALAPTSTGDYHLMKGSTCIDKGDDNLFITEYNSRWSNIIGMDDLDRFDRIQDAAIDLGPYEDLGNRTRDMWYGTESTDWNNADNWLDKIVPDNGADIRFHPNAIRDLLVPATHSDGNVITARNIYNQSRVGLVLNSQKLNITGEMDFNTASAKIDARQKNSNLSLNGSGVNQDIVSGLLVNQTVYDLTIDRTDDVTVENTLRILNKLDIKSTGLLDASEANILYGLGSEDYSTVNDDRNYIQETADFDKAAYTDYPTEDVEQVITNGLYRNETIRNLDMENTKGVSIRNGQGGENVAILTVSNDLTIRQNSNMIVESAAGIEIQNRVYNNAGTDGLLIRTGVEMDGDKLKQIAPTGTFVFYNPEFMPVHGGVEFFQKGSYNAEGATGYKYKWQYFTIPVREIPAVPTFTGTYIRKWKETQNYEEGTPYWEEITNSSVLNSFNGYEITATNSKLITIKGILENRDLNMPLTYTTYNKEDHPGWHEDEDESMNQMPFEGQHVIGNPYMAAIDIEKMEFENNIEATIYIFNTGTFMDWVNEGKGEFKPDELDNPGQYVVIPKGMAGKTPEGSNITLPSQIPPMQGFSVIRSDEGTAEENTFKLSYASIASKNNTALRSSKQQQEIYTFIRMESEHCKDFVWLSLNPDCRKGFDNGWDGRKFIGMSAAAQIFTIEGEEDETFQISSMDDFDDTYLGFKAAEKDTEYTLTFNHTNLELAYEEIRLIDLLENKTIDVTKSGSTYTFTAGNSKGIQKRFRIETTAIDEEPDVPTGGKVEDADEILIYIYQKDIIISHKGIQSGSVYMYDTTGKCILTKNLDATESTTIKAEFVPEGVYIIKVSSDNKLINKSIIL